MMPAFIFVVAAALQDEQGRLLLAQRPAGKSLEGLWEFPGGKLEEGERPEEALARELHEELGITVLPQDLTPLTFASHAYNDFHLFMPLFLCRTWEGTPEGKEGQKLAWVAPQELETYPMPPADAPLAARLKENSGY